MWLARFAFQACSFNHSDISPFRSITYGLWIEPNVICAQACALTLSASPNILTGYGRPPS
jgi:hypothetical protein